MVVGVWVLLTGAATVDPHIVFGGKLAQHGSQTAPRHFFRIVKVVIALIGPVFRKGNELCAARMGFRDEICGSLQVVLIIGVGV